MPAVSASNVGAYGVEITGSYVHVDGAKCSCRLSGGYYGYHKDITFLNYCPYCYHHGTLRYEVGPASWTSPEGLYYCTVCDVDYCCVHGLSHDNKGLYLTPSKKPEPITEKPKTEPARALSPLDKAMNCYKTNEIIKIH